MHKAARLIPAVVLVGLTIYAAVYLASRSAAQGSLTVSGTIEADEVTLTAELGGRIQSIEAEEGDRVEAGQVLVRLDDSLLQAQRGQAEAALQAAQAAARAAQANLALLRAGPSAEQLAAARALVDQAQVAYDAAQETYDDLSTAARDTTAGKQTRQARDRAEAALKTAEAQYNLTASGARTEQIAAAQAQADAAAAQAGAAQAALAALDVQIGKLALSAPAAGVVLTRSAAQGEMAVPGAPLLVLGKVERLTLTIYVPEERYGRILLGQSLEVRVDSFPGETFPATVERIAGQAEFTPRNVQTADSRKTTVFAVKLVVQNRDEKLKPGMPADVTLP